MCYIHDGARMFVDEAILQRGYEYVEKIWRLCSRNAKQRYGQDGG